MKGFIKFTDNYGKFPIYINPTYIVSVDEGEDLDSNEIFTVIHTVEGAYDVAGTPTQIINIIEDMLND